MVGGEDCVGIVAAAWAGFYQGLVDEERKSSSNHRPISVYSTKGIGDDVGSTPAPRSTAVPDRR